MNAIKRIINENLYDKLSLRYIEKIAMKYFSTFDDDDLKILYLTKAYERLDPSMLSMSPYLCAELLVQSGTFEGGQ